MEALEDRDQQPFPFQPARGEAKQHRDFSAPREQALWSPVPFDPFSPVTTGFWLGGAGMGAGGGILGALMPYHHPVAVLMSVLWWGIYFGAFGASIGALVGHLTDRASPRSWPRRERAGKVAAELVRDSRESQKD
jgi:hypothetical protein